MTRIAFFAPAPWDTISGGYVYDRAIVAGLRDLGHDVAVRTLSGAHPLPDARAQAAAAAAWAALEPDALPLIDGLALPSFAPDAIAARRTVGVIHHPTALETGRTPAARDALRAAETALFPRLWRTIVTSTDTAARLAAFGVDPARVRIVEPGTPLLPRSDGPAATVCDILSVATLLPRKGHDVLLRALARLGDLDWHLTIAGGAPDPDHAASLQDLADGPALRGRVTFAGALDPDELEPLWASAGLFALATHYEGYGMAIAEALRRGLPVAVTAGGAAAALVTPECGVVCEPGDHEQLSKALRRLIYDRALRGEMADAAWTAGRALPQWPAQAERFADILQET